MVKPYLSQMRTGDYLKAVGSAIRELRTAQELSQEDLADRAKMSRNMLSLIERGEGNPSLRKLVELTNALEMTPAELLSQAEGRSR